MNEHGTTGVLTKTGGNLVPAEKRVPVPVCPSQIPHRLALLSTVTDWNA